MSYYYDGAAGDGPGGRGTPAERRDSQHRSASALSFTREREELTSQPSFMTSAATLPGALGISDAPWQQRRGSDGRGSTASPAPSLALAGGRSVTPSRYGDDKEQLSRSSFQARSGSAASLPFDNAGDARPGSAHSAPRTFLVPVGSTGARQKLNILSASKRPWPSGAAALADQSGRESSGASASDRQSMRKLSSSLPRPATALESLGHGSPPRFSAAGNGKAPSSRSSSGDAQPGPSSRPSTGGAGANGSPKQPLRKTSEDSMAALASGLNAARETFQPPASLPLSRSASASTSDDEARHVAVRSKSRDELRSTSSGSAKGFFGGAPTARSTSRPEHSADLNNGPEQRPQAVERNGGAGRVDHARPSTAPKVAAGESLSRGSQPRPSTASSIGRASMRNLKSMFGGKRESSDVSPPMGSAATSGSPEVSGRPSASEAAAPGRANAASSSPQMGMRGLGHRTLPSRSLSSEHSLDFGLGTSGLFIEGADPAQSQSTSSVNSSFASRSGTTASSFLPDAPDLGFGFDELSTIFSQYKTSSPTPLEVQSAAKQALPVLELDDADPAATLRVPPPAASAQMGLAVDDKSLPPTPHTPSPTQSPAPAPARAQPSERPPVHEAAASSGWAPVVSKDSSTSDRTAAGLSGQGSVSGTDSPRSSQSFAASLLPLRRGAAEQVSARSRGSGLSTASRASPSPAPTPVSSRGYLPRPGPVSSSFQSPLLATLHDPSAVKAAAAFTPTHQRQASAPTASTWKAEADEGGSVRPTAPRQDAPAKQRERPATLQADAATLMRLEGLTAAPASSAPVTTAVPAAVAATATAAAPAPAAPPIDAATFVPAGALTHTRRGVRVKAGAPSPDAAARLAAEDSTPRGSGEHGRKNGRGAATNSVHESRSARQGDGQIISFNSNDFDLGEQRSSLDEAAGMLPAQAWAEVNTALKRFKEGASLDKGALLRSVLLPFLALEAETPIVEVEGGGPFASGKARRTLFFEWIRLLLLDLQHVQTSADRGAILESIACIIESRNFSAPVLTSDPEDEARFSSVFGHILSYAIGELNKKGVYQNTLIFSGRLLAVAFFRVDGVASKLLRALPVNRFALERVATEAGWDTMQPADWDDYCMRFPVSLQPFCYRDARSYLKVLDSQTLAGTGEDENEEDRYLVRQPEVEVEMTGNWLRRWQSDDSELFFSFCRSFHRQLASLMSARDTFDAAASRAFFGAPGYAHLTTCIHQKCLSLVHRDILSVTTLSSQKNFNPGETANVLSGSTAGKPRHLEAANRRCTAIVVDIVRAPSTSNHMFGPMLGAHVKCLLKRTSLYDVQGVFCVMDWLDGVLNHIDTAELHAESLIDIDFIIETVGLLLREADHALALMRTIAFCYSNFGVLTSTKRNRTRFCEDILLNPAVFEKLFLSWSFTIRAYFLHLLVFRLARINDFPNPADDVKGKTNVSVAHLFNQRLDDIRRRHDELSPSSGATDSGSETEEQKMGDSSGKSRPRPLSFVSTIRHTPSVHRPETTKAERVLGIGLPDPVLTSKAEIKTQSRAAKWLRALGAKGGAARTKGKEPLSAGSDASGSPNSNGFIESPTIKNEPRARMPRLDELDSDSDDDDIDGASGTSSPWDKSTISSFGGGETPRAEDGPSPGPEFSFEGRIGPDSTDAVQPSNGDHLAPDVSFDLQSPTSQLPPASHAISNGRASPRHGAASPRVSRAFSKRSSFLPGPAYDLVNQGDEAPPVPSVPTHLRRSYDKTLHVYAVQSLREYEQTVQEHDEYFAGSSLPDGSTPAVPRLPINWPAMWASE